MDHKIRYSTYFIFWIVLGVTVGILFAQETSVFAGILPQAGEVLFSDANQKEFKLDANQARLNESWSFLWYWFNQPNHSELREKIIQKIEPQAENAGGLKEFFYSDDGKFKLRRPYFTDLEKEKVNQKQGHFIGDLLKEDSAEVEAKFRKVFDFMKEEYCVLSPSDTAYCGKAVSLEKRGEIWLNRTVDYLKNVKVDSPSLVKDLIQVADHSAVIQEHLRSNCNDCNAKKGPELKAKAEAILKELQSPKEVPLEDNEEKWKKLLSKIIRTHSRQGKHLEDAVKNEMITRYQVKSPDQPKDPTENLPADQPPPPSSLGLQNFGATCFINAVIKLLLPHPGLSQKEWELTQGGNKEIAQSLKDLLHPLMEGEKKISDKEIEDKLSSLLKKVPVDKKTYEDLHAIPEGDPALYLSELVEQTGLQKVMGDLQLRECVRLNKKLKGKKLKCERSNPLGILPLSKEHFQNEKTLHGGFLNLLEKKDPKLKDRQSVLISDEKDFSSVIFQIRRAEFKEGEVGKWDDPIELNTEIQVPYYLSTDGTPEHILSDKKIQSRKKSLFLSSVVVHEGPNLGGHYMTYIRHPEGWVRHNDQEVLLLKKGTQAYLDAEVSIKENAYLVLYSEKNLNP